MYYVFISILLTWTVASSDIISKQFVGTKPKPVLVGSNVIFNWTYSGEVDKIRIIRFHFNDSGTLNEMLHFVVKSQESSSVDAVLGGYCDSVDWLGDTTKNISAFKMNNIMASAHKKLFAVEFYLGSSATEETNQQELFISVPPKVNLQVSNTNLTAGDKVTIECKVTQGRPEPKIMWYHNDKLLPGKNQKILIDNEEIQKTNAGSYKCLATNDAGKSPSKVVDVKVHDTSDGDNNGGDPKARKNSSGLSTGAVVGIVLAVLVIIVIIIVVAYIVIKTKGKPSKIARKSNTDDETQVGMVTNTENVDQVWL